jgi:hypothetical protein
MRTTNPIMGYGPDTPKAMMTSGSRTRIVPSYFVRQKLNEPVKMEVAFKLDTQNYPIGFEAGISRKPLNALPSYPLRGYRAVWELRDRDGKLLKHGQQGLQDLEQTERFTAAWPEDDFVKETLTLRVVDPQGYDVAMRAIDAVNGRFGGENPVPATK